MHDWIRRHAWIVLAGVTRWQVVRRGIAGRHVVRMVGRQSRPGVDRRRGFDHDGFFGLRRPRPILGPPVGPRSGTRCVRRRCWSLLADRDRRASMAIRSRWIKRRNEWRRRHFGFERIMRSSSQGTPLQWIWMYKLGLGARDTIRTVESLLFARTGEHHRRSRRRAGLVVAERLPLQANAVQLQTLLRVALKYASAGHFQSFA